MNKSIQHIIILIITFCITVSLYSQEKKVEYITFYNSKEYKKSLDLIINKLQEIYAARVSDKRVPTGFISMKDADKNVDLVQLYRKRKAKGFFIENNQELSTLHLYAARCYHKLKKYLYSANHYTESLRYKHLEYKKDDVTYYELSQVYKDSNYSEAYYNFLETAITLNPQKSEYSLELANALYKTRKVKTAIYHYEKYLKNSDEDPDPIIYLKLGSLYERIGKFLETEKNYIKYLKIKPEDGSIHFALGYITYRRTGNHELAITSLKKSLELLPEDSIIKRSRAHEYRADMEMKNLEYKKAIENYLKTIEYQDKVNVKIEKVNEEIKEMQNAINNYKSSLLKEQDFDKFDQYENLLEKKGGKELELRNIKISYKKLNSGKIRWNTALSYEQIENYEEAIKFYRKSIKFDYRANKARTRIIKLKLKIKRGY